MNWPEAFVSVGLLTVLALFFIFLFHGWPWRNDK